MTQSPFQLLPGPERRALMARMGLNIGRDDYTDDEWAAVEAETQRIRAAHDALVDD